MIGITVVIHLGEYSEESADTIPVMQERTSVFSRNYVRRTSYTCNQQYPIKETIYNKYANK